MVKRWLVCLCCLWLLAGCGGDAGEEAVVGPAVPTTVPVVLVEVPDLVGQTTGFAHGAADMAGLSLLVVESPDLVVSSGVHHRSVGEFPVVVGYADGC